MKVTENPTIPRASEPESAGHIITSMPMVKKTCARCGATFEVLQSPFEKYQAHCEPCVEKFRSEEASKVVVVDADRRWKKLCPPAYLATDPARLPNPRKLDEVLAWRSGPRGLLLHGETGTGKSRCAWLLLRREMANGSGVKVLDSTAGLRYAAQFHESARAAEQWLDRLITVDLLLLDDIFKVKLTEAFEGVLFSLVDGRIQRALPTIITSNDTGDSLSGRLTQDKAAPLIRRLREEFQVVRF